VECTDGVEALTALTGSQCNFAILDVDMPGMGGLETLEEIRASEATCNLPVIILTAERDQDVVIKLMQLGVSHYIVKPLKRANFVAKIESLLKTLPADQTQPDGTPVHLSADKPTLVVDGDASFRAVLAEQVQPFGPVLQAESGAAALIAFRRTPADVVFIGSQLGVMSAERLATKIREVKPWGVRLVRIVDGTGQAAGDGFDGSMVRSTDASVIKDELKSFLALDKAS
jgi:CheY-like chemotaxis protein